MATMTIFDGRDGDGGVWTVAYEYDPQTKMVSGLSIVNNTNQSLDLKVIVSGQTGELTVDKGVSRLWDFPSSLSYIEPDLTSIGKPGQYGFVIPGLEHISAGLV